MVGKRSSARRGVGARVVVLAAAIVAAAALVAPAGAQAACGGLWAQLGLQRPCPPPPPAGPSYPDPGGVESPDQPVPAPGKRFGFSSSLSLVGRATAERELDAARAAGANVQRSVIKWSVVQPTRRAPLPTPDQPAAPGSELDWVDRFYAAALARGITPIFTVGWSPVWATRYRSCGLLDLDCQRIARSNHNLPPDVDHLPHFLAYVQAVKARWPRALIEAWNEPDAFWRHPAYTGSRAFPASPEYFKAIQCAAYSASKSVNGDPVLSAGWAMAQAGEYVRRVHAAGGSSCWDIANVHAYPRGQITFTTGSALAQTFELFRLIRANSGDADPIWVTETGFTTTGEQAVSEHVQAEAAPRLYNRIITMPDVAAVLFHTLRDASSSSALVTSSEYGYGFLRWDWTRKPVFCEFAAAAGRPC